MYVCNFCHEFRDYVAKGPDVCICEVCVATIGSDNETTQQDRCSFCHQTARASKWRFRVRRIVLIGTRNDVAICSDCVRIARGVLDHKGALDASEGDRVCG